MNGRKLSVLVIAMFMAMVGGVSASEGAVGYWNFDEGSGMVAGDSAGDNDGTLIGATWTDGVSGSALSFDGVDDYVNIGNGASLQIDNDITVELWAKTPTASATKVFISKYADSERGWEMWHDNTGKVTFGGRDGSGDYRSSGIVTEIDDGEWHHIVGQRSGSVWKIFVDGDLSDKNDVGTTGSINAPALDLVIGEESSNLGVGFQYNGKIDEVVIYDRALSAEEIKTSYESGQSGLGDGNKGHGNDPDGVDEDNPGKGCENKNQEHGNKKRC